MLGGEGGSEVCQSCDNRSLGDVCVCVCAWDVYCISERERERERLAHIQYNYSQALFFKCLLYLSEAARVMYIRLYERDRERERKKENGTHTVYSQALFKHLFTCLRQRVCVHKVCTYIWEREREGACTVYSQAQFFINVYFTRLRRHVCVYEIICIYVWERELKKCIHSIQPSAIFFKDVFPLWGSMCVCLRVWDFIYSLKRMTMT